MGQRHWTPNTDRANEGRTLRRVAGITLIEVLVAGTLLLGFSLVLHRVMLMASAGQRKQSVASDMTTECSLVATRIEQALRGGRLISPTMADGTLTELNYEAAARNAAGHFEILPSGLPNWQGPVLVHLVAHPDGGQLVQEDEVGQPPRVFGRLGDAGTVSFTRLSPSLLQLQIVGQITNPDDSSRSFRAETVTRLYLQNLYP